MFADLWTCTDASKILPTQLDKWIKPILDKGLQDGPNSIEMTESLKEIGYPSLVSLAEIARAHILSS